MVGAAAGPRVGSGIGATVPVNISAVHVSLLKGKQSSPKIANSHVTLLFGVPYVLLALNVLALVAITTPAPTK